MAGWGTIFMKLLSFKRHRSPVDVIRHAVWLYFRFSLSLRDVEALMAERGVEVSRETVRCWVIKFGPLIAANLRRNRNRPTGRRHLDEAVCRIGGRRMYLWRAVDDEGEVLDVLVQRRRNNQATLKLLPRRLRNTGVHPETIITDKLALYRAAMKVLHLQGRHRPGLRVLRSHARPRGRPQPKRPETRRAGRSAVGQS